MTTVNELDVLLPGSALTLAGISVTVHEYTLSEQLKHRATLKAITGALQSLLDSARGGSVSLDALADALAGVADAVIDAVAVSCDQTPGWVAGLHGEDADTLLYTWWGVNAGFFTRQVLIPTLEKITREASAPMLRDGVSSSQPSSVTDTPPASYATTPSGS